MTDYKPLPPLAPNEALIYDVWKTSGDLSEAFAGLDPADIESDAVQRAKLARLIHLMRKQLDVLTDRYALKTD